MKIICIMLVVAMLTGGALASCSDDDNKKTETKDNNGSTPQDNNGNSTQDDNGNSTQDDNEDSKTTGNEDNGQSTYTPADDNPGTVPAGDISLADANTPAEVMKAMGMGWNLGNQFDAYNNGVSGETAWSQPKATQQTFDKVAAAGMKTVRIPITWMGHIGSAPDYKIEDAWLDRIAEVVGYAENAGLNAIINIHHDGSNSEHWLDIKNCAKDAAKQQNTIAQLSAMWTQIAEKFKDKGHFLVFELLNEIQDGQWGWGENRSDGGKQYNALNEWIKAMVDAIRATGGKNADRWIGVPAYDTNIDLSEYLVLPDDPAHRLMVSIHYYTPYEYTLEYQYQQWGHTAQSGQTTNYGQETECQNEMKKLYNRFIAKGIPVYIGEMGNVNRGNETAEKFREYYFEYVLKCIHDNNMPAILWDNGAKNSGREAHGYFNHGTGDWMNDYSERMVKVMVKAMTTEDASYTLQSVYDAMK